MKTTRENLLKSGFDEHEGAFFKTNGVQRIDVYLRPDLVSQPVS